MNINQKNWTGKPSSRKGVKNSEEVRNKIKEALSKTLHPKSRAVIDNIGIVTGKQIGRAHV